MKKAGKIRNYSLPEKVMADGRSHCYGHQVTPNNLWSENMSE
jgi:hypothetical protein